MYYRSSCLSIKFSLTKRGLDATLFVFEAKHEWKRKRKIHRTRLLEKCDARICAVFFFFICIDRDGGKRNVLDITSKQLGDDINSKLFVQNFKSND